MPNGILGRVGASAKVGHRDGAERAVSPMYIVNRSFTTIPEATLRFVHQSVLCARRTRLAVFTYVVNRREISLS